MSVARIIVSRNAIADQDAILSYLYREAGSGVAERYFEAFKAAISLCSEFPGLGAPRPSLGEGIRTYLIAPYIVIYEGKPKGVEIIVHRIVHGRQSITSDLLKG